MISLVEKVLGLYFKLFQLQSDYAKLEVMLKWLIIFASLLFSVYLPKTVFADNIKTSVTTDPAIITQDTKTVTATITNEDPNKTFSTDKSIYKFIVKYQGTSVSNAITIDTSNPPPGPNLQNLDPGNGKVLSAATNKIVISWDLRQDNEKIIGPWALTVFTGSHLSGDSPNDNNTVVKEYDFDITQPGGGQVQLQAVNPTPQLGTKPQVLIINPQNILYDLWWNGSHSVAIEVNNQSSGGALNPITIPTGPDNAEAGQSYKLCLHAGRIEHLFADWSCDASTTFTFVPFGQAHPTLSCIIAPQKVYEDSNVSIVGTNLPDGSYDSRYSSDNTHYTAGRSGTTQSGAVNLFLNSSLSPGSYNAQIVNQSTHSPVCTVSFSINQGKATSGSGPNSAPIACQGSCSSSSGAKCDVTTGDFVTTQMDPDTSKIIYTNTKTTKTIDVSEVGIFTAIGCIPTQPQPLIKGLLQFILAIAGGVALLLMAFGAFGMITSAGNPEALKAAQGRFSSAIIGLVFIIFSVLLLQIIGADILNIPGFGH